MSMLRHIRIYTRQYSFLAIMALMLLSFKGQSSPNDPPGKKTIKKDSTSNTEKKFPDLLTKKKTDSLNSGDFPLNPQMVSFLNQYKSKQGNELEKMRGWGKPYFDLYDKILTDYGLPVEMKYLSVIESHLQSRLRSWAGAVGPWQLMSYEGKRFGLKMGGGVDERTDFYKSTVVAAKLLNELHEQFGDWLLVIAAYNGGAGRVRQAIKKAGSNDFWQLQSYLPEETRNHVKKFIATHYIFEGGGGWTTLTAKEASTFKQSGKMPSVTKQATQEELNNCTVFNLAGKYNSVVIANKLMMNLDEFQKLNPDFDETLKEGSFYQMRLPSDKAQLFQSKKQEILRECVQTLLAQPATPTSLK